MYVNQSKFVRHDSCERCGSRDNVAWYSNGTGFCFGCGAFYRNRDRTLEHSFKEERSSRTNSPPASERINRYEDETNHETCSLVRPPPTDLGTYYPTIVVEWMQKYHISVTDMMRFNVRWSPSREQIVYLFYGEGKDVVLWQARNFRQGTTHANRFFTGGTPETVVAAYYPEQGAGQTAVVVEDCASGIKLAKSGFTGIPVFGAKMSASKMNRICQMFENVIWWLDNDKFVESAKQSNLCKLLGVNSHVVNTAYDPKEYSVAEVKDILDDRKHHN